MVADQNVLLCAQLTPTRIQCNINYCALTITENKSKRLPRRLNAANCLHFGNITHSWRRALPLKFNFANALHFGNVLHS